MKKNTFYLFIGCIALALLAIFWYSIEVHLPIIIIIAFIIGIILIYLVRRKVTDFIEDERSAKITSDGRNANISDILDSVLCVLHWCSYGSSSHTSVS